MMLITAVTTFSAEKNPYAHKTCTIIPNDPKILFIERQLPIEDRSPSYSWLHPPWPQGGLPLCKRLAKLGPKGFLKVQGVPGTSEGTY